MHRRLHERALREEGTGTKYGRIDFLRQSHKPAQIALSVDVGVCRRDKVVLPDATKGGRRERIRHSKENATNA